MLWYNQFMELPDRYLNEMKELLGDEYEAYFNSMSLSPYSGLRVNTSKISVEEFLRISPFHLTPIPWTKNGFYYDPEDQPSQHPFYDAGLYYLQEPSAMLPAQIMPLEEGDTVLDLCAAPGGKTTQLALKTAVLFSNDISFSRQKATLRNVEKFGLSNTLVCAEDASNMAELLPEYFDRILVDAPCSGEGMFRKDNNLIKSWMEKDSSYYAPIQKNILKAAVRMLKPGGTLVYSTCTFSIKENEEVIGEILNEYPELRILPIENRYEGFAGGIGERFKNCVRLYPHRLNGEGHFAALLQKGSAPVEKQPVTKVQSVINNRGFREFMKLIRPGLFDNNLSLINNMIIRSPLSEVPRLRYLRSGLLLGEVKKDQFEPSQHLAMALKKTDFAQTVSLKPDDVRVRKYLKGETIEYDSTLKGWVLVCVEDYPLGFGKIESRKIKNKLPKGYQR